MAVNPDYFAHSDIGKQLIACGLFDEDGDPLFDVGGSGSGSGVDVVAVDPVSPDDGEVWILIEGVSPARQATLKIQDGATLVEVPLVTY